MSTLTRAVLMTILSGLFFVIETALVKAITGVPLTTIVMARSLGQLLWVAPLVLRDPGLVRTGSPWMQFLRGALSTASWYFYYTSFGGLPLATATVLAFSTVLFVTALAGPILGETVRWRRWTATLVGFAGVLAIARPGTVELGWPIVASLVAALISAVIVMTTKTLARTERTTTIIFYIGAVSALVTVPAAIPNLAWPGWWNLLLLVLCGLCGPLAMSIWISALRTVDASLLAPVNYVRLIFATLIGILLFGEVPDWWLALGATLIIGSALYISRRESTVSRTDRSRPKAE